MKKVLRILIELDDRRTTLMGLALALATLNWLTTRAPQEAGALEALGISLAQAQAAAALSLPLMAALAAGEPSLRQTLADHPGWRGLLVVLGAAGCALAPLLSTHPDQAFRLARMPFSAWVVAAHG